MMRKGRIILLSVVVLTFAVSSVIAFQRHKQTAEIISISGKTTAWTLVRLESEYLKFMQLLHLFALGDLAPEVLRQRFDILWSRTEILLIGRESEELRRQPGVKKLVLRLQNTLADIETIIFQMQPSKNADYLQVRGKLESFYLPLRDAVVENFRGNQAHLSMEKADQIQQEIGFYLLGLMLSGAMLIGLVLNESRKSHRQSLHDSLTGLPNRLFFSKHLGTSLKKAKKNVS